jgi:hypothetical protein
MINKTIILDLMSLKLDIKGNNKINKYKILHASSILWGQQCNFVIFALYLKSNDYMLNS